ncbi:hypothetical protein ANN_12846 [Periplaneta americana]|uniref:Reverse transcriptase domain-containing protein n=1 Tax=Periplaneta americana TaxID=6978 RepID=A0ABQ8TIQ9_PERAM|nr:hypothetical protein ANN_12846 [Periplaneta americana]
MAGLCEGGIVPAGSLKAICFINRHSTTTALLKISEDIREAIDRRGITLLTLIDFSRAFDTVEIDILISKLRQMHLSESAVTWMDSYLRDRQQCVYHDNCCSSWRHVRAGVPQGSVLGPLLFTLYINGISSVLEHCQYHLYADDLQAYIHSRPDTVNERLSNLNDDLLSINNSARKFGLNINPDKTQAILLGQQRLLSSINMNTLQPVSLNNKIIPFSATVKNLGTYFDSNMNWNTQIRYICRNVCSIMQSLKRLKKFLPTKLKQILVQTLVMPHFDYCDVLYSDLSAELSQKLPRVHSTPNYLASRFTFLASHHSRNTRSQHNLLLSIPRHHTSLYSSILKERNEAVLERVGEERMMLKLIRKRKRNCMGHWLRRNCLLKDAREGMVNGEEFETEENSEKTEKNNEKTQENSEKTEESNEKTEENNEKTEDNNEKTEENNKKTEKNNEKTEGNNEKTEGNNEKTEENN